jgi:hypothetical protein
MKIPHFIVLSTILFISFSGKSQKRKFEFPSFDIVRSGPYVGWQKGIYNNIELGFEQQWKDLKLFRSQTAAIFGGLNFNILNGVIGEDIGVWRKLGFLGVTYGVSLNHRTNFTFHKVGFSPMIGVKVGRFHCHTGYQFLFPNNKEDGVNNFFVSLRFKIWSTKKIVKN